MVLNTKEDTERNDEALRHVLDDEEKEPTGPEKPTKQERYKQSFTYFLKSLAKSNKIKFKPN